MATTSAQTDLPDIRTDAVSPSQRWEVSLVAVAVLATSIVLALAATTGEGPRRLAHSWLVNGWWVLSPALGSLFFIAIQHLVRAGWSVSVRRIAEVLGATIIAPLLMLSPLLALLLWGNRELFPWNDTALVASSAVLTGKVAFLNAPFFAIRAVLYATVWIGCAHWYLRTSRRQDDSQDKWITLTLERRSAPILILLAVTTTFAAFDWLMSLDPYWFSTIFGVYVFSGVIVSALAVLAIVTGVLVWNETTAAVTREHLHDVVKLLFGMNCFWAYIAFSQYLLIWYADIPEETVWLKHRQEHGWNHVTLVLAIGHFILPFIVLMPRAAKRHPPLVIAMSGLLLVTHWLDLYWIVYPQFGEAPVLGAIEIVSAVAFLSTAGVFVVRRLRGHAFLPIHDPRLPESIAHHVH